MLFYENGAEEKPGILICTKKDRKKNMEAEMDVVGCHMEFQEKGNRNGCCWN